MRADSAQLPGSIKGRVCVVTGATSGLGFATAMRLAEMGASVVLGGPTEAEVHGARERIAKAVPEADLHFGVGDLSDLAEVRRLGTRLLSRFPRIDVLVNNAGVYRSRRHITNDGFELTFAVNHLSHFLLTHLLLPSLLEAAGRVINVTSEWHRYAKLYRPVEAIARGEGLYMGWRAYADSKLAGVLFTAELARRFEADALSTVAVHPGTLATRLGHGTFAPVGLILRLLKPILEAPSIGGDALVYLTQAPRESLHGEYYHKEFTRTPAPSMKDVGLARTLWNESASLVGLQDRPTSSGS